MTPHYVLRMIDRGNRWYVPRVIATGFANQAIEYQSGIMKFDLPPSDLKMQKSLRDFKPVLRVPANYVGPMI